MSLAGFAAAMELWACAARKKIVWVRCLYDTFSSTKHTSPLPTHAGRICQGISKAARPSLRGRAALWSEGYVPISHSHAKGAGCPANNAELLSMHMHSPSELLCC